MPNYVTESSYTEDIPARTNVGDAQDRRLLAILNLETGKTAWADASFAPPVVEDAKPAQRRRTADAAPKPASADAARHARRARPSATCAGRCPQCPTTARSRWRSARSADNKDRWLVTVDPETGKTRVVDLLHDDAWVREVGGRAGDPSLQFVPDSSASWFLSERDGWMHLYTVDVADADGRRPRQLTSGKWEIDAARAVARRARSSTSRAPRCIPASGRSTRCRSTAARARSSPR